MDQALLQVGLPVKCSWGDCGIKAFVKAGTDHDGWTRRWRKKWYCPEHSKKAQQKYDAFVEQYKNLELESKTETTEEELYKLLD